jgi:hypothetical protein
VLRPKTKGVEVKERRWKLVALLAAGMAVGVVMVGTPAGAHIGSVTHLWNQHIKPKTDARYYKKSTANNRFLPGGNLPAGSTIRGSFIVFNANAVGGDLTTTNVMFGWRLASAPTAHYLAPGAPPTANCPGSVLSPQARAGHLCFYGRLEINVASVTLYDPTTNEFGALAGNRFGSVIAAVSTAAGIVEIDGSWAVRAPAPGGSPRPSHSDRPTQGIQGAS